MLKALLLAVAVSAEVQWREEAGLIEIENGYTRLSLNTQSGSIVSLAADFHGLGKYGENVLAAPFGLEVVRAKDNCSEAGGKGGGKGEGKGGEWLRRDAGGVSLRLSVVDCASDPLVQESWTVSLDQHERAARLGVEGGVVQGRREQVSVIRHTVYTTSTSLYALFERGVAQRMGDVGACMGSYDTLNRAYALGGGAALDVLHSAQKGPGGSGTVSAGMGAGGQPTRTVLRSASAKGTPPTPSYGSAVEYVLHGQYPNTQYDFSTAWGARCWDGAPPTAVDDSLKWGLEWSLLPNDFDFPALPLNNLRTGDGKGGEGGESGSKGERDDGNGGGEGGKGGEGGYGGYGVPGLPFPQLRALLTGIYASPAGCLQSYYHQQAGTIAPTIAHPDVGYTPDTNFFDPDNFLALSALLHSQDPYFIAQAGGVLLRTGGTMCGIGGEADEAYCGQGSSSAHRTGFSLLRFAQTVESEESGGVGESIGE
ncbi:hypothetical protein B484DRAFT_417533, partial [Ochromonadaceae sp. CCMP2298]